MLYAALVVLGLTQAVGYAVGSSILSLVGFVSVASPLPLVFSSGEQMEFFAADYRVRYFVARGISVERQIDSRLFQSLPGIFSRRSPYMLAVAYGPELYGPLWQSVLKYGLCNHGPLAQILEEQRPILYGKFLLRSKTRQNEKERELFVSCL